MIGDKERGSAWTLAFLGLRAKVIHVCGDERAVKLIKTLCKITGDDVIYFICKFKLRQVMILLF